jgi:hypothetical protein
MAKGETEMDSITIVVVAMGAWGKGPTYEVALANCIKAEGPQNAMNMHLVYACTDPTCSVNGRGDVEYEHGAALTKILAIRHGRIMAGKGKT